MTETTRESNDLSLIKEDINISLDNTEKILNDQENVENLLSLDAEDQKKIKKFIEKIDDNDIRGLDTEQLKKEMKERGFSTNDIAEVEKYATTLKTNPKKLKEDVDNQFIPPRIIIPIIIGLFWGCSEKKEETPDRRMENLFKELKKRDLVYKGNINVLGGSYRFNSIRAQKIGKDIEIYVKGMLIAVPPELEYYCLVYNEDKKVFTYRELNALGNVDYEEEIGAEKVEYTLIDIESRVDAIKNAIKKKDIKEKDEDESFIERASKKGWREIKKKF